jgi:hypothetical protein
MAYQSHHCSATLLCSACISVLLLLASSCAPPVQLLFFLLCSMLPLHSFRCISDLHFRYCATSLTTHLHDSRKITLYSLFCMFFSPRVLCLIIIQTLRLLWQLFRICSSSVGVILRFLGFSSSRNSSSSLSVTTSHLWLLWLLSPFLHVTTGGDQTPIQKALPDLGLVSASSVSRYDLGR